MLNNNAFKTSIYDLYLDHRNLGNINVKLNIKAINRDQYYEECISFIIEFTEILSDYVNRQIYTYELDSNFINIDNTLKRLVEYYYSKYPNMFLNR